MDFEADWRWEHCSPSLLNEGLNCTLTPRRACACPVDGSHDHLVQRGWPDDPVQRMEDEWWTPFDDPRVWQDHD